MDLKPFLYFLLSSLFVLSYVEVASFTAFTDDDSWYPASGRDDDWCEDQYEDDEQGCIADALCEPEYEDDGTFDDCEDIDDDDDDDDDDDHDDKKGHDDKSDKKDAGKVIIGIIGIVLLIYLFAMMRSPTPEKLYFEEE